MTKTILVAGYGPGISTAVAERFGAEGFQIAGTIKGTSSDRGGAMSIDNNAVADKYWELYTTRKDVRATIKPS